MAGLGGTESDFHRLAVAHFADQNDLGCLAQSGTQTVGIGIEIESQFALVKSGFFMGMLIFDRILKGDDMYRFAFVDLIQNRCQRGGFTGTRSAGNKYQTIFFLRNLIHGFWQRVVFNRRNF